MGWRSRALVLAVPLAWCACGGAAPAPQDPSSPQRNQEVTTIGGASSGEPQESAGQLSQQDASRQLDDAELRIEAMFAVPGTDALGAGDQPAPTQTATPSNPQDACDQACAALASMRRASQRLCQLVGADDDICSDAQARFEAARSLVESRCPACATD